MMNLLTSTFGVAILFLFLFVCIGYLGVPLWLWSLYAAAVLGVCQAPFWVWIVFGVTALIFNVPQLRQRLITRYLVKAIAALKLLPKISDTEREAIEAGNVWVEGEFFSGKPNFQRLLSEPYPLIPQNSQLLNNSELRTQGRPRVAVRRKGTRPCTNSELIPQRFFGFQQMSNSFPCLLFFQQRDK